MVIAACQVSGGFLSVMRWLAIAGITIIPIKILYNGFMKSEAF
jgi:hypothetical protein